MILEPLEADKDKYNKVYQILQKKINDQNTFYDMPYILFLETVVEMSEDECISCIRGSLNSCKVFLKRNTQ